MGNICFTMGKFMLRRVASTYCNKVTNRCNCLFCYKFISFIFILHVSGSHKPIIRGISSCFLYTTIWFMWCLCCLSACACGLVCRGGFTVLVPWWFFCTSGSACALWTASILKLFFIYNHLVHVVFMLLVCVCLRTGLSWWFHRTGAVVVLLY